MSNKYVTLARREFWEYRSLWLGPIVVTGLMFLAMLVTIFFVIGRLQLQGSWGGNIQLPPGANRMAIGLFGSATQILGITAIISFLFLIDCLHAERKDRSILFWKSLPVSDAATVLVKYTVGLVLAPLLGYLLVSVVFPVSFAVASLAAPQMVQGAGGWDTLAWLRAEGSLLAAMLVSMLWYAPIAAWALLASVAARRMPIAYAILPVLAVGIVQSILVRSLDASILLRSLNVWGYLAHRLTPVVDVAGGLQRLDLWLGLVVAAAMIYAAIRMRRYRDDT